MGEVGYTISERDYQRMERVLRRVERMTEINFYRRQPVGGWSPGGDGFRMPDYPQVVIDDATPSQLDESLHENRWLWCNVSGDPLLGIPLTGSKNLIMPPNPAVRKIYYFASVGSAYYLHIYPGPGQIIRMPNRDLNFAQYVALDAAGLSAITSILILACTAANTWICCDATHASYGP
jgi:hypothetical protein